MRQKITITLGVADLEKADRFYEKGLAWKNLQNLVLFEVGGVGLVLYP